MNAGFAPTPGEFRALQSENAALRQQLTEAQGMAEHWKSEAQIRASQKQQDRLQLAFRMTPAEAAILGALYVQRGQVARREHLFEALPCYDHADDDRDIKIVDVLLCRLRKKLPAGSIAGLWGAGWYLTPVGLGACDLAV